MKYDFTSIPDRSKDGAAKWNEGASTEFVPLSVADMEFYTAPKIKEALKNLAENSILGYTNPTERYFKALKSWMKRRHGFDIENEWVITTPGVVDALGLIIDGVTNVGEAVLILTPVYYPFDMSVVAKGRHIVYSKLINNNGIYEIDREDFLKKVKRKDVTALLLSNPHNPVGKVWTKEELTFFAENCCENGVFIIDDEIHNDLIMKGYEHTVLANISEDIKNNCAVCTAPSKTFNLAGLQCSNIIIPNKEYRQKVELCSKINLHSHLNIFAYTACETAYNECEDWLEELLGVIKSNAEYVENFMKENFPSVKCSPLEGTYLQWIDMRSLGFTHEEMKDILEGEKIFVDNGEMFGICGRGFQRINLACAQKTLENALERFKNGVNKKLSEYEKNGKPVHINLEKGVEFTDINNDGKKKIIAFSRPLGSYFSENIFSYLDIISEKTNKDIYVFVPSEKEITEKENEKHVYTLISDENGDIFKKYNCFETFSGIQLVAGDESFEQYCDKIVNKPLFDTELLKILFGICENNIKRNLQLPVFAVLDENNTVISAYYGETATGFPEKTFFN